MSEEQNVDLTFREAITELGQIVEALESNKLELEESLVKYERGIVLIRFLRGRLEDVYKRQVQYPEFVQGDSPRIGVFLGEGVAGEEQR